MERIIKFRAKAMSEDEWVYGDLIHYNRQCHEKVTIKEFGGFLESDVVEETVCQFTGLHDKNGKEIYDGDIICSFDSSGFRILHKVAYHEAEASNVAFLISCPFDYCHITQDWINEFDKEIIGNIYDNQDLLKGGQK